MAVLLGRTSAGTNADFNADSFTAVWRFQALATGTVTVLKGQTQVANATATSVRMGMYSDSAGEPNTLLSVQDVDSLAAAQGTGVFQATLSTPVAVTSGTFYWIGWRGAGEQWNWTGDLSGAYKETLAATNFQTPWPTGGDGDGTRNAILWGEGESGGILLPMVPVRFAPIMLQRYHKKLFAWPSIPVFAAPTAQFIDITFASESNTAQALTKFKNKTLGFAVETDAAQALDKDKLKTLGFASESDAAQPFIKVKSKTLGIATESDVAQVLSKPIRKTLGITTESDVAQALTKAKSKVLGITTEADAAQPFVKSKRKTLGVATEADAAQPLTKRKTIVLIPATETDTAQALSITHGGGPQFITITPATEADVAQALSKFKSKTLGVSVETDAAQALTKVKRVTIISATETDAAQVLVHLKRLGIAPATETDAAQALTKFKSKVLGITSETDSARPLVFTKTIFKTLTPAQEFDVAVPLSIAGETVTIVYKYRGPITIGRF